MKTRLPRALALVWLAHSAAFGQMPSTGSPTDFNAAFFKLFGSGAAFTAKVDTQVLDARQKEWASMPMVMAAFDNKVRLEVNMAEVKSAGLPESAIAKLKQMGMDRVVSIIRPDKKATFVLYPGAQGYVTMPLAAAEVAAWERGLKLEKAPLGKETLDGHACVKHRAIVSNSQGPVLEATTWNAADLKEFPIQIETKEKGNTVVMRFSQVQLAKPAARQFEVPKGYGQMK